MEFQVDVAGVLGGLSQLEKFPKNGLRRVMRQATNIILADAREHAPYKDGLLEKSIILKEENSKTPYKTSFRVTFKGGPDTGLFSIGKVSGNRSFYPASQEYGWKVMGGKDWQTVLYQKPGLHYMRWSGDETSDKVKQMIVDEFDKVIDGVMNGTLSSTGARIRNGG